jgi:hypothetical protein
MTGETTDSARFQFADQLVEDLDQFTRFVRCEFNRVSIRIACLYVNGAAVGNPQCDVVGDGVDRAVRHN